jgi:hypothetical protein
MPADWNVDSLRCASTGLAPVMRSERWIAVACGPAAECIAADADDAEGAFVALVERVDARTTSSWARAPIQSIAAVPVRSPRPDPPL